MNKKQKMLIACIGSGLPIWLANKMNKKPYKKKNNEWNNWRISQCYKISIDEIESNSENLLWAGHLKKQKTMMRTVGFQWFPIV
jgi:hypothetical protein